MTGHAVFVVAIAIFGFALISRRVEGSSFTPPMLFAAIGFLMASNSFGSTPFDIDHHAIQLIAESKGVQELEEAVLLGHPLPLYHVEIKEELKHKLMESLLNVATIDHDFDETEESLLREIGKTIGFEDQLLAQLVELGHSRAQQFHSTQLHAPNARARV